jgi:hypothetical protein
MNTIQDAPSHKALPTGAALEPYTLVKASSGTYVAAGAADVALGTTLRRYASGETCQPRRHVAGNLVCLASAAIAQGATVVQAASGKVVTLPTSGGGSARVVGIASHDSAAADGDPIEIEPIGFGTVVTIAT